VSAAWEIRAKAAIAAARGEKEEIAMIYEYIGGPCAGDVQDIQGMDHGGDYIIPCVQMVRSSDLQDMHPCFSSHVYELDPKTRQAWYVGREEKP